MMLQDSAIIYDRTVGQWRQLAGRYNHPHLTAEDLAQFIDAYREVERKDYFNPLRQANIEKDIYDQECEVMEMLLKLEEQCAETLNSAQLEYLEQEIGPFFDYISAAVNVKTPKS